MKTKSIKTPDNWKTAKIHPLAQVIEFGSNIDLEGMAAHAKAYGYDNDEALVFFEGMLLEGRHRREICKRIGVIPPCREFCGKSAEAYVSKKLYRQHLSVAERAKIAARLADLPVGANQHSPGWTNGPPSMSLSAAAKAVGVSRRSVQRAKAKSSPKTTTPKSGSVKFPYKEYLSDLGKVYRWIDKFGNAYDCKESTMARELRDLCKVFKHKFDSWVQFNTKEAVPDYGDPTS